MGDFSDFETPYGYTGPLSTSNDESFLTKAWNAFSDYCKEQSIVAGFVRFHPLLETHQNVPRHMPLIFERETIAVAARPEEEIWAQYKSGNRNRIRFAAKSGVQIRSTIGRNALEDFSRLYSERMVELGAHDDYLFPESYFRDIDILLPGRYKVFFAEWENTTIGGHLFLYSRRLAHYHLGAVPRKYAHLCTSNALMHHAIIDANDGCCEYIHLGGGMTGVDSDSLLRYKSGFSPLRRKFYVCGLVCDESLYQEICHNWQEGNPQAAKQFGNRILRYRYED